MKEKREARNKKISAKLKKLIAEGKKVGARMPSNVNTKRLLKLRKQGLTQMQIAKKLNVSQGLVSRKLKGASDAK